MSYEANQLIGDYYHAIRGPKKRKVQPGEDRLVAYIVERAQEADRLSRIEAIEDYERQFG